MKMFKKAAALLLAVMMIASLTVSVCAAQTGSITINDSGSHSVAGKTFNAYKVLDAIAKDPEHPGTNISYTIPADLVDFYAERYYDEPANKASKQEFIDDPGFEQTVIGAIRDEMDGKLATSGRGPQAFAKAVLVAAKAALSETPTGTVTANDNAESATIDNLPLGYYVIEDTGDHKPVSALMLDTPNNTAITLKAEKTSVSKQIDGTKDTDASTSGDVSYNSAAVGDKIPFKVSTKVPDMIGYTKFFFVVNDTLSKGLAFNNDVAITIGSTTLETTAYDVTSTENSDGTTAVKIVFKNFIDQAAEKGKEILITYTATVDTDAVIGVEGNSNKATILYSDDPSVTPKENPDNPDEPHADDKEAVTGETAASETVTYVTGVKLNKVDTADKPLQGAKFKIEGTSLNTVLVRKGTFAAGEGAYYQLKDGTYTTVAPTDETLSQYVDKTKYTRTEETESIVKEEQVSYEGIVGADGVLSFDGLGAGTYTITELVAPEGYHLLEEPITITITCEMPGEAAATKNCTWKVTGDASAADGVVAIKVVNETGTILPSTGGMGTTIFYVVGTMLIMMSGVILITRKRVNNI